MNQDIVELRAFLPCQTPEAWLVKAVDNIPLLLIDHAHCERKAALSALNLISMAPENSALVDLMSPLAREEMLHFEKVLELCKKRHISFKTLIPSRYAINLHQLSHKKDKQKRLLDLLLIGAIIEARSCERFAALVEVLQDAELIRFYTSLVKAEARHFREYLNLAQNIDSNHQQRLQQFLDRENEYINSPDPDFRFHSGKPVI